MSGNHVMLDLETLGTKPGCMVLSVSGFVFDPTGNSEGSVDHLVEPTLAFTQRVKVMSMQGTGLTLDYGTLDWWFGQPDAMRAMKLMTPFHIRNVLQAFNKWFSDVNGQFVWGQGATFDPPILEAAMRAVNVTTPWNFYDVRDTRTVYHMAYGSSRADMSHNPKPHVGIYDAWAQAVAVQRAIQEIKLAEKFF